MVQNLILKAGDKSILVSSNNSSNFVKWLTERFKEPTFVTSSTVKGILNKFDELGANQDNVVFRGDLLEWLWENQNKTVTLSFN